ncbi:TIGR03089 family protein [Arthrobacter sp. TMN-37]
MDQHTTPAAVLSRLRTATSPRLVWYGPDGRIELSGRVFDNWVAKTSNFLIEELDASPGTRVALDLPVHWKSLAWAMACWQVGAVLAPATGAPAGGRAAGAGTLPDVVVSSTGREPVEPPAVLVAVALGPLALRWPDPLPPGAVDYAAEVRSYADYFADAVEQDASTVLFDGAGSGPAQGPLTVAGLHRLYSAAAPAGVVLLGADTTLPRALAAALTVWGGDGTLVLVHPEVAVTQGLLDGERVEARASFAADAG